jgi:CRP-like cAMP-binding protein
MGRIFGAYDGISVGGMVLGAFVAAPLVHAAGLRSSMLLLGLVAVGVALLCVPVLVGLDNANAGKVVALSPRIDALSKLSIFDGASRSALERLAGAATELQVGAGMIVVGEGDPADAFYVTMDGDLDVSAVGEAGGAARHLRTLHAGSYFGEIGLIERIPRTATVRTVTGCTLLRISGDDFLDSLTAAPAGLSSMGEGVVRALARTHPSMKARGLDELLGPIPAQGDGDSDAELAPLAGGRS